MLALVGRSSSEGMKSNVITFHATIAGYTSKYAARRYRRSRRHAFKKPTPYLKKKNHPQEKKNYRPSLKQKGKTKPTNNTEEAKTPRMFGKKTLV